MSFYEHVNVILGATNVVLGLAISYFSGRTCLSHWRKFPICTLFSLMGICWALIYTISTLRSLGVPFAFLPPSGTGVDTFGGIFVRPMFTLTLLVMALLSLDRYRRSKPNGLGNGK